MAQQPHEKSPAKSSAPSAMSEEERNLSRAISAYDHLGEAGLQRELDRLYPNTGLRRTKFMKNSYAILPPANPDDAKTG